MTHPKSINHTQALELIVNQSAQILIKTERLPVHAANRRVISKAIKAPINVPEFDCSRMDGFAINLDLLKPVKNHDTYQLALGAAIHAAAQNEAVLCGDKAIPIMTGAVLPKDANAIVLKEQTEIKNNQLHFNDLPIKDRYIRSAGSDLKQGQLVIGANQCLLPAHLGLMSSLGLSIVEVYKPVQVALMMSGDELVPPGGHCLPGQIYDANSIMLATLLNDMGCEVVILDALIDSKAAVTARLNQLKQQSYDLIISVGGVSMGDKDWIPTVLEQQGEVLFHKLQVKPGFPMLFGQLGGAMYCGLPGNPVSAYSTLCQYVYPAIKALLHCEPDNLIWKGTLSHGFEKTHDRKEFIRAFYENTGQTGSHLQVSVCGQQDSSRIESLAEANCFLVLPAEKQQLKEGDEVNIQPFYQFKH